MINLFIIKTPLIGNVRIFIIIKDIKATKVIAIDALKASKIERLVKTIQITDSGIHPGSGINNNRGEVSKNTDLQIQ